MEREISLSFIKGERSAVMATADGDPFGDNFATALRRGVGVLLVKNIQSMADGVAYRVQLARPIAAHDELEQLQRIIRAAMPDTAVTFTIDMIDDNADPDSSDQLAIA